MKTKQNWIIPAAPEAVDNIVLSRSIREDGRTHTFVKTGDGKVYRLTPPRSIDIADSWDSNMNLRRAVCKLTGWKLADLQAYMRKRKEDDAKRELKRRINSIRLSAERLGYRLVKLPAPKPRD